MARTKKPPREPLSNVAARHACITDGFARRFALDQQIAELEAEHIKPLKDDRSKAWKNVAADTGLAITDLTDQYRIYKRQQLAKSFTDDADRDTVLDAQREIFEALQAGQTLDFLDVLGRAAEKPKRDSVFKGAAVTAVVPAAATAEPDGTADQDPRTSPLFTPHRGMGEAVHRNGQGVEANPHDGGTPEHLAWTVGWYRAEGAAAYARDEAITSCRHSTGSEAWKDWNHGWNRAAKKDGKDAATVGAAAAVKGAAGDDMPDIPPALRRSRKPTTAQAGNA